MNRRPIWNCVSVFALVLGACGPLEGEVSDESVEAAELGLLAVRTGYYKLPAAVDATVAPIATELWAQVTRPTSGGPYPLVILLHGEHQTCGHVVGGVRMDDNHAYTTTGKCPAGYTVVPNHLGYQYLASPLASYGFVVVSINTNRGINYADGVAGDTGLNLRRGRMVLRHLQQLAHWNAAGGAPVATLGADLKGDIDFTHVGLMGHSRGGEGVRAAVNLYNDSRSPWPARIGPRVTFRSVFEIGPVDGQTSRVLNANNLHWNVLLPGCDGDVSDMEGMKPFDRMISSGAETGLFHKSTMFVLGANHNFYNSQWLLNDIGDPCVNQTPLPNQGTGSSAQRSTAINTVIPFFRSNLAKNPTPSLALIFDPSRPLPAALTSVTSFIRGYSATPRSSENFIIDNFTGATGTSSRGQHNIATGVRYSHVAAGMVDDPSLHAASVSWKEAGGTLDVNAASASAPVNATAYKSLEFRVVMSCEGTSCDGAPIARGNVDFSIQLATGNGLSSPVTLASRAAVRIPMGSAEGATPIFQTVRTPLTAFVDSATASFEGVRFSFDRTPRGSVFIANLRLVKDLAANTVLPGTAQLELPPIAQVALPQTPDVNEIAAIRRVPTEGAVEIDLTSSRAFQVGGSLPVLKVGEVVSDISRFPSEASDHLVFSIPESDFDSLGAGVPVRLRIGGARAWTFGPLDKTLVK